MRDLFEVRNQCDIITAVKHHDVVGLPQCFKQGQHVGGRWEWYILLMQVKRQARKRNDVAATLADEYLVDLGLTSECRLWHWHPHWQHRGHSVPLSLKLGTGAIDPVLFLG